MIAPKYVYFIKPVGMDGPIKIGSSAEPEKRLNTLATWSPFPLEIIGKVLGGSSDENYLHRRFADLHTHREWFLSSPLLRETIARILAGEDFKSACVAIPIAGSIRNQKKRRTTPERQRFIDYGAKIRKTIPLSNKEGSYFAPPDVRKIMDDWRGNYLDRKPVTPTAEQIARLDEYLSNPPAHAVFIGWRSTDGRNLDDVLMQAFVEQHPQRAAA